ncbi:bifunctional aspartate kinase/homoserine dehydrogenase I [Flavobacterium sp. '19STA2R22 D10 B1']|uniref:bifunctional aspartate kinase/homoserine dehydrogenase I n=1 Tax=Flavobacterium aerium TaxID=3037261 RepID=UPI00278BFC39|nr:bifunctional aspartate kinase/homoserine dehydrogenase I [Flavobacterium sp. '19STA2R22 D10 B1']
MNIIKFGGTSVANAENINKVVAIINRKSKSEPVVVVVSAFGGITDLLLLAGNQAAVKDEKYKISLEEVNKRHLNVVKELIPVVQQSAILSVVKRALNHLEALLEGSYLLGEFSCRTKDAVLSYGELLSSFILSEVLKLIYPKTVYKDSQSLIKTNNEFGKAVVNFEITNNLIQYFFDKNQSRITIVPGFVASSEEGNITTLGRGGSDYTAAIIAAALDVSKLEIWTDVNGMYTANPKLVKQAQSIPYISYHEAMELSHFGAKVLYPPTIQPVLDKDIVIHIKNTFDPEAKGTIISNHPVKKQNEDVVRGISHIDHIALLTLEGSGLIGVIGSSKRFFEVLSNEKINIVFITQASSEHSICIGIHEMDAQKAKDLINQEFKFEIRLRKINSVVLEKNLSIIAIVGENMKNHKGLSGKMFSTLGKNNINIRAIAQGASERNISAVIANSDAKKALNCLHERFFEAQIKQLNLFVMGVGNVGQKFIEQIQQQKEYLCRNLKLNIRIIALANSKKMIFEAEGISLMYWEEQLQNGLESNVDDFIKNIKKLNLRNSIFVDITANENVAHSYHKYLKRNIAVVTCNKIACSSSFEQYKNLKNRARENNVPFLFETNVGAGLPIIDTLKNLIASGDQVHKIQAVLSGSLNFVFNNYNETNTFHDVVEQAKDEGYTEPNPKIDLSGVDVMRKLLILIRESGYVMDIEAIKNKSFLPNNCLETDSITSFFASLKEQEPHFKALYKKAVAQESRLKYVAQFEDGKASVELQLIPKEHPFYNLDGKDNIVLFYTDRYHEQPLLIKGAGAGAAVTASGIFADVIRIGNI